MRSLWKVMLGLSLVCFFTSQVVYAESRPLTFTGRVVDDQGQALAGASVYFVGVLNAPRFHPHEVKVLTEETTLPDGSFSLSLAANEEQYYYTVVLAKKAGHAWGWAEWYAREDKVGDITLGVPKDLSGHAVDENGRPVSGADVSLAFALLGKRENRRAFNDLIGTKLFSVKTGLDGSFCIQDLPAQGTFELLVKKPGLATFSSFNWSSFSSQRGCQYRPGQPDIKLVVPVQMTVRGAVVDGANARPVPDVTLILMQDRGHPAWGQVPVVSGGDGRIKLEALMPGKYTLQLLTPDQAKAEWVAEPMSLDLKAGQTVEDLRVTLSKGGFLEVMVRDSATEAPIDGVSVSVRCPKTGQWHGSETDDQGLARLRLLPQSYQISSIHKEAYQYQQSRQAKTLVIEEGRTVRLNWELTAKPLVTGRVFDPEGKPLEGADIVVLPGHRTTTCSDAQGKFEMAWDPRPWGEEEMVSCLVARHEGRKLGLAVPVSEGLGPMKLTLKPGVTFVGQVTDSHDKGIANAQLRLMLRVSNWGSPLNQTQPRTDAQGRFEIPGIPVDNRYSLDVTADGFGPSDKDVDTAEAKNGQLDIGQIKLVLANMQISGRVVNENGEVVPSAEIESGGEGQPEVNAASDGQGRFILEGLCPGEVFLRVNARMGDQRLSGRTATEAGASNIDLVIGAGRPVTRYIRTKSFDQIIQGGKTFVAGQVTDESATPVSGVPVKVCCIKRERSEGKYSWTFSSYSSLADVTNEQGRFIIELEEEVEYNLRFSSKQHAAMVVYDVPAGTKDLKVLLPKGGTVTGQLLRMSQGQRIPIPNAEVELKQTDRSSFSHLGFDRDRKTVTDNEGRFRFEYVRRLIREDSRSSVFVPRVWELSYAQTSKTITFPGDETIQTVDLIVRPKVADAASLLGRPLPDFSGIRLDLDRDKLKGKKLLLCFFDYEQRPARRCVTQLNKQLAALQDQGVTVMAILTSKVDQAELTQWMEKTKIELPVGTIDGGTDEVRFAWNVQSLPWLVLTDREHVVRAEGFGMAELTRKTQALGDM
jgi:hypothetical protein